MNSISQRTIDLIVSTLENEISSNEEKITNLESDIKSHKIALEQIKNGALSGISELHISLNGEIKKSKRIKPTLRKILSDLLQAEIPVTSGEILKKSNEIKKENKTAKQFSANLSQLVNKSNDFKLHKGEEGNYYGFKEWFNNSGFLKPDFLVKIKKNKEQLILATP